MRRKLLLLFLASSFCNLHASSENSPLLEDSSSSSSIPRHTDSPGPSYYLSSYLSGSASILTPEQIGQIQQAGDTLFQQVQPGIMGRDILQLPEDFKLGYLENLDYKGWKKWIKTYGTAESLNYLMAIDSAAEYAEKHLRNWKDLRKKMIEEPCWLYRKTHSDTMKNRRLFFNEVARRVEFRVMITRLQSQNKCLMTRITALQEGEGDLEQKLQEEIRAREIQAAGFREESEALKKRLEEEIAKRSTLEQSLAEKKQSEEIPTVQESIPQELTPQIGELQRQLEEFKASITLSNAELTRKIQALSEKVDAMDLDGIRAEVAELTKDFSAYKEGAIPPAQFDAFTVVLLALRKLADPTQIKEAENEIRAQISQSE